MTQEYDSVTDDPVAEDHEGVNAEVADQHEAEANPKEYNFRRLEKSRDEALERANKLEQQLAVLNDRINRMDAPRNEQPQKDPDDLISYREYKEDLQREAQRMEERLMKIEAKANYPDLDEVISKYGKKLSPAVAQACMRADNPYLAAYEACKNSEAYYREKLEKEQHEYAKRAETNARKPRHPDKVGGRGSLGGGVDYSKMSEAELLRMGDRHRLG